MATASEQWQEVGEGVFRRRHHNLDVNCGAVLGDGAVLVIDTRCHHEEGRELLAALRLLSAAPVTVVNTHAHFDHCFGNHSFMPAAIWGHRACAGDLRATGELQRQAMRAAYPQMAKALAAVQIIPPAHLVEDRAVLDVGGRTVELVHHGRGHTDHDLVVLVPDAGCVFAGDLLEDGAPPAYEDAWPLDWPATLERLLAGAATVFVPGHGDVMDRAGATAQQQEITAMARLCAGVAAGEIDSMEAAREAPFPEPVARVALQRAAALLAGQNTDAGR